jgi:hypothetical protein
MAKKVIKEVEFKFSPTFDKVINGEVKIKTIKPVGAKKATKKAKAKTTTITKVKAKQIVKAAAKPAKPKTKSKYPRGYTVTKTERELTIDGVKSTRTLYELSGNKLDRTRYFVDEASVQAYIGKLENGTAMSKALSVSGFAYVKGVAAAHKELMDAADVPELTTDGADKCDKTSIEDTDA